MYSNKYQMKVCPACKTQLEAEMKFEIRKAQYTIIDKIYFASTPRLYMICVHCHYNITYSNATFYTLQYIETMRDYMEKIHHATKEM